MNNKSEDRGMLKWAPFHSVMSEEEVLDVIKMKEKYPKPELSEDQINELEYLIVEAYNSKNMVELTIYNNGKFITKSGIITKLDGINKCIYLDKQMILFNNIIKFNYI